MTHTTSSWYDAKYEVFQDHEKQIKMIKLPSDITDKLDIGPQDELTMKRDDDGSISIVSTKQVSVELELNDQDLFRYMQVAHERGITFNQLVNDATQSFLMKQFEIEKSKS